MYQKLITAGCSYSACSSSIEEALCNPTSWPHFLSGLVRNPQLVNLGIPGSGPQSMTYNLINFCEADAIDTDKTLVAFNISELHRWDVMCTPDHPESCEYFSWAGILNHSWILSENCCQCGRKHFMHQLGMNMGVDQQIKTNCLSIISLVRYLKQKNLNYRFIMLDDNLNNNTTPDFFKRFLQSELEHIVTVQECYSVLEFAKKSGMIESDQFHPSKEGYRVIAEHIFEHLKTNTIL